MKKHNDRRHDEWKELVGPAHGELVIVLDDLRVGRLLGLAEGKKGGFFCVLEMPHVGAIVSTSKCIKLKGRIDDKNYDRNISIFDLNYKFDPSDLDGKFDGYNIFLNEEDLK